jgi:hypothetical protein
MAVGGGGGGGGSRAEGVKAGRAYVAVGADDTELRTVLGNIRKRVLGVGKALAAGGGVLAGLGAGILAPIAESFREVVKYFDEFSQAANRTGATTEALSALAYAAQQSDASLEDVANGTKFLQKNLSEAAAGSQQAADAFAALGLKADDLKGKSLEEQFALIADGLANIEDPADRTAAAIGVLGRGGLALLPMLGKGSGALRELLKEAEDVGAVIGGKDAENATRIGDSIRKSWTAVKNTFRAVGAALLPQVDVIEQWSTVFVDAIKNVREFINDNRELILAVTGGAAALVVLGTTLVAIGSGLAIATFAVGGFLSALTAAGAALAVVFSPVGLGIAALATAGVLLVALAADLGLIEDAANVLGPVFTGLADIFKQTWGGIKDALAAGDLKLALKVAVAGLDTVWQGFLLGLTAAWNEFKGVFVDGWHSAMTEVQVLLADVLRFFGDSLKNIVDQIPDRIVRNLPKETQALLELGKLGGNVKSEADIRADAAKAQAEREAARNADLLAQAMAFAAARIDLAGAVAEAGQAKYAKLATTFALAGLGALLAQDRTKQAAAGVAAASMGTFGTFGNAAQMFGARGGIMEAIKDNTKRTADGVERLGDKELAWE